MPDTTPPTVTAPSVALLKGRYSFAAPVRISWTGSDHGLGVVGYILEQNRDEGGWDTVDSTSTASSLVRELPRTVGYRFRVQAIDGAGLTSTWATSREYFVDLFDQSSKTSYAGNWATTKNTAAYVGGSARRTTKAGASATFTFKGIQAALIAPCTSTGGSAKVYVDNVYRGTVSLHGATSWRAIPWVSATLSNGTHHVRLVVTKGTFTLDGWLVLR